MNIKKEEDYIGSYLSMHGKRGPLKQFYQSEIVPDNVTRTDIDMDQLGKIFFFFKSSLDLIPSPSVKIQIMGGNIGLRCIGKTLLGIVNKLLKTKSLLSSSRNVLPYYLK